MDDGDLAGSLPYFVEALRLDGDDPWRRRRPPPAAGLLLDQCPKPARIWFHDQPVIDVAFRPDGGAVAVALRDGTVAVYDVESGRPAGPVLRHADRVECLDFSPDGRRLVTGCLDHTARVWDIASGREVVPWSIRGVVRWTLFSPDGRLIATTARGRNTDDPPRTIFSAGSGTPPPASP